MSYQTSSVHLLNSNLSELSGNTNKKSAVLTATQINNAAGGSYFSSGNVTIIYNEHYAQVDFALYLKTQFNANTQYKFTLPVKTQYAQRWTTTGYGKHFILVVADGTFVVLPAENITAGDNFRDSFFGLRK